MMKRTFSLLLSLLLLCGLCVGCDRAGSKENELTPYPVNVANVTVTQTPEKVVCLSPSLTELTCELGYGSRLAGKTTDATYPESVKELPTVGGTGHIDLSALITLAPDTVLSHESLSKKEMTALEAANIQVIVLPMATDLNQLQALYQTLALLYAGQLDAPDVAARHYAVIAQGLDAVKKALPEAAATGGFAYVINPSAGIVATGDTLESSILSAVFGENAAKDGTDYKVELTTLTQAQPPILFTAQPYGLPHLQANKSYESLTAVKNKAVAAIDNTLLACQSARLVEAIKAAAKALYPDSFAEEPVSSAPAETPTESN